MNQQTTLTAELLEKELKLLVEKKIISERVADKLKQKIQKEKLLLNQTDLIKLIDHVQFLLNVKTSKEPNHQLSDHSIQNIDLIHNPDLSINVDYNTPQNPSQQSEITEIDRKINHKKTEHKKNIDDQQSTIKKQKNDISQISNYSITPLSDLVNDPEHIIILFKWLQYLIDKIGNEQLPTILGYYVDIDWITKNVYMNLLKYAKGITFTEEEKTKQYHPVLFTVTDHLQSFLFIQKLKGTSLTEDLIWKIDNELDQMERSLHNHHQPHNRK